MMSNLIVKAVEAVMKEKAAYCKFLSANDSGETGGHQSGILISKTAKSLFFSDEELRNQSILKKGGRIRWQDDFFTDCTFTWYKSKNEFRLTRFGRGFPLLRPEYTGALFVLVKQTDEDYLGFIFNSDEGIQAFLDSFGLSPTETNRPIELKFIDPVVKEKAEIEKFIKGLKVDFPSSSEMALTARKIYDEVYGNRNLTITDPDLTLLHWIEKEYLLFKTVENYRYRDMISKGFESVDVFISLANQVLNRRKSRAGKSLEHHLSHIFDENHIKYTAQAQTEGSKKPDFLFPSEEAYHDKSFSINKICTLAAKTTCKDRWRQIINEADRLRDQNKYLCTLQQGISSAQMDEMENEKVILVVPKTYIKTYPRDRQSRIWTISRFVDYVKEMEDL